MSNSEKKMQITRKNLVVSQYAWKFPELLAVCILQGALSSDFHHINWIRETLSLFIMESGVEIRWRDVARASCHVHL